MDTKPLFLILPGVTADADRFAACLAQAKDHWPEADVAMPDYLSRLRGVEGVGRWLDKWLSKEAAEDRELFVLAYILGGAALPYAPALSQRIKRAVLMRSGPQEQVPVVLRQRLGLLAAPFFGRAVWDLGKGPYWPVGYSPAWPHKFLIEGKPSQAALKLGIQECAPDLAAAEEQETLPLNHDFAYHSGKLMSKAVEFLKRT